MSSVLNKKEKKTKQKKIKKISSYFNKRGDDNCSKFHLFISSTIHWQCYDYEICIQLLAFKKKYSETLVSSNTEYLTSLTAETVCNSEMRNKWKIGNEIIHENDFSTQSKTI